MRSSILISLMVLFTYGMQTCQAQDPAPPSNNELVQQSDQGVGAEVATTPEAPAEAATFNPREDVVERGLVSSMLSGFMTLGLNQASFSYSNCCGGGGWGSEPGVLRFLGLAFVLTAFWYIGRMSLHRRNQYTLH